MRTSFMLRRTLCPWNLDSLIAETVACCRESAVDEIAWISESSGRYRELLPIEGIRGLIPGLAKAKAATEAAGLLFSINPLTTLGHGEYGNDVKRAHPRMDFMVDYTGRVSRAAACPLSPYWRNLMVETFRLYAELRPARLWIEDDFRYSNHGPVTFGCFCDLHLDAFAQRTGRRYAREELVSCLLRPGKPAPERAQWLEFLEETLAATARLIADAVHAVAPEVQLGWMSNCAAVHDVAGTGSTALLNALEGVAPAAIRMSTAPYFEQGHRDLYTVDEQLKRIVDRLPEGTTCCTEVETIPHSYFSKSAAGLAAQMTWSGIVGFPNHTLNLYDYLGSPMAQNPVYPKMLKTRKREIDAFAETFAGASSADGVGLIATARKGAFVQTSTGTRWHELAAREAGWITPLRAFGVPAVFSNSRSVTAVTGQALRTLDPAGLEALFARGVLLDGSAAAVLEDMGFADLAGIRIAERIPATGRAIGPEELTDLAFGGGPWHYVWGSLLRPELLFRLDPQARMISRIVDLEGELLMPGFTLFENRLGGRVAACPYDLGGLGLDPFVNREPTYFYSEYRKIQLRAVLRWLARGPLPLQVEADGWVLPHRADAPGEIRVAAMNLNADPWERVAMQVAASQPLAGIEWVAIDGTRRPLDRDAWTQADGRVELRLDTKVPPLRTVAAVLSYSVS